MAPRASGPPTPSERQSTRLKRPSCGRRDYGLGSSRAGQGCSRSGSANRPARPHSADRPGDPFDRKGTGRAAGGAARGAPRASARSGPRPNAKGAGRAAARTNHTLGSSHRASRPRLPAWVASRNEGGPRFEWGRRLVSISRTPGRALPGATSRGFTKCRRRSTRRRTPSPSWRMTTLPWAGGSPAASRGTTLASPAAPFGAFAVAVDP